MAKNIEYLDGDQNPYTVVASNESNVIISNIETTFTLALVGTDGEAVEYEIVAADGGPLLRPHRPR